MTQETLSNEALLQRFEYSLEAMFGPERSLDTRDKDFVELEETRREILTRLNMAEEYRKLCKT